MIESTTEHAAKILIERCANMGLTLGTAESVTGGLVSGALTAVPGSSGVFRGGVVAYSNDVKHRVLHVSKELIAQGVVTREVTLQMAKGIRTLMGVDVGLACSGVAGPGADRGVLQGTVWIACSTSKDQHAELLKLEGNRDQVRSETVARLIQSAFTFLDK